MLFNSLNYLIFLTIVFTLYWLVQERFKWIVLLVASYYFYMCSGPQYGLLILGITVVSYLSALCISKSKDNGIKKIVLVGTILIFLLILFFFKYFNFFINTTNSIMSLFGVGQDFVTINIVLPVGISFYTFQTMSYVIDVYRGTTKAENHIGKYATFVSFFPQLVAGPIERSNNLLSQIKAKHVFSYDKAMHGVKLMLWGYFKKLLIADLVSEYVQKVFDNPHNFTGFALLIAALFFTVQIYCDFSGYSDIAVGTAMLFGINLMTNFKSPYFSGSIREFWGRWHISLSTWFRDYIYIPLGGNRVGKIRHSFNLIVTFLVSGLWHGANWTFIVWGGVHGIAQALESLTIGKRENKSKLLHYIRVLLVFVFCVFSWVFFVSHSISDALYVLSSCWNGIVNPINYLKCGISAVGIESEMLILIGVFILTLTVHDFISIKNDFVEWITSKNRIVQWCFYLVIGLVIVLFSKKGVAAEFIYFQF